MDQIFSSTNSMKDAQNNQNIKMSFYDDDDTEFIPHEMRRHQQRQSKDDATYGLFGHDGDEQERPSTKKSSFLKGINFVASGRMIVGDKVIDKNEVQQSTSLNNEKPIEELTEEEILKMMNDDHGSTSSTNNSNDKMEIDEELNQQPKSNADFKNFFLQPTTSVDTKSNEPKKPSYIITAPKKPAAQKTNDVPETQQKQQSTKIPPSAATSNVNKDPEFGRFLDNKVGNNVLRMMRKMNWDAGSGMGKDGNGIVNPIKVLKTGKNHAVVVSDHHVQRTKTVNKESEEAELEEQPAHRWKKSDVKKKKKKVVYKTADELLKEKEATKKHRLPKQNYEIIDMTGDEARVLSGYDELSSRSRGVSATTAASRIFPELQYNIRELVGITEARIQEVDQKIHEEKGKFTVLDAQRKKLEETAKQQATSVASFKEVLNIASTCFARMNSASDPLSLDTLHDVFEMLQYKHKEIYEKYGIANCAIALAAPLIRARFEDWKPSEAPRQNVVLIARWKKLLSPPAEPEVKRRGWRKEVEQKLLEANTKEDHYEKLLEEVVLPKLRSELKNIDLVQHCDVAVAIAEAWFGVITEPMRTHLIDHLILPVLAKIIDNDWNPSDLPRIHTWIHPWLPVLGESYSEKMEQQFDIFPAIRRKFGSHFKTWNPSDKSAHEILAPWKQVFEDKDFNKILLQVIIPKLIITLRQELAIDPSAQDLLPFQNVIVWSDVIPHQQMISLLEAEFFPKWNTVLYEWLCQPECSLEQVTRWFYGWKGLIPDTLTKSRKIQMQFSRAMDMINQATSNQQITPSHLLPPPSAVLSKSAKKTKSRSQPVPEQYELSFKELIEQYAAENDLIFVPKEGKVNGKQLYNFAGLSTYIHNDCLYLKSGDTWQPVTLDEYLQKAQAKTTDK
jgi:tuftelin-interacting protein 11